MLLLWWGEGEGRVVCSAVVIGAAKAFIVWGEPLTVVLAAIVEVKCCQAAILR
jgi:hypothetical protein